MFNKALYIKELKNNDNFEVAGPNEVNIKTLGKAYLENGKEYNKMLNKKLLESIFTMMRKTKVIGKQSPGAEKLG